MDRNKMFVGISLVTMSVLMLELCLTRIFSATMYYHFAFMAISLALFGSGASGVLIYIIQRRLAPSSTSRWLSLASQLFAVSTVVALYVVLTHPLSLEATISTYYTLAMVYAVTTLPFFFAGCVVTLGITRFAAEISRLYVFDLAGAAIGCSLMIPVLNRIGAINTVLLVSACAAAAAVLFCTTAAAPRIYVIGSWFLPAVLIATLVYNVATRRLDVRFSKSGEETSVLFSKWNSFSRITVHGDLNKESLKILIDSDAATGIFRDASNTTAHPENF